MLPHWPETLINIGFCTLYGKEFRVLLQPNKIELRLLKIDFLHGFKAKVIEQQTMEVEDETQIPSQLSSALQNPIWRRYSPVLVLSNAFVRYAVLTWNDEIKTKQERSVYLQHSFLQHFGEVSKHWLLCEHLAGYGQASIASGIDQVLFKQLEAIFAAADMPLKAAHPLLMLAMNQALVYFKKSKLQQSFWLACFESERLALVLIVQGEWKLVHNVSLEPDANLQLHTLIQRETVLENADESLPVLLFADGEIRQVDSRSLPSMQAVSQTESMQPTSCFVQRKWVA